MNLPSIRLARPTVSITGDDERQLAHARHRVTELEKTDADVQREINERYLVALNEERIAALLKLRHAEANPPDEREQVMTFHPDERPTLEPAPQTWGERATEARAHIAAIDAELERVSTP